MTRGWREYATVADKTFKQRNCLKIDGRLTKWSRLDASTRWRPSGGGRRGAKRATQQETHSLDARREDADRAVVVKTVDLVALGAHRDLYRSAPSSGRVGGGTDERIKYKHTKPRHNPTPDLKPRSLAFGVTWAARGIPRGGSR